MANDSLIAENTLNPSALEVSSFSFGKALGGLKNTFSKNESPVYLPSPLSREPVEFEKEQKLIKAMAEGLVQSKILTPRSIEGNSFAGGEVATRILSGVQAQAHELVSSGAYDRYLEAADQGRKDFIGKAVQDPEAVYDFMNKAQSLEGVNKLEKVSTTRRTPRQ